MPQLVELDKSKALYFVQINSEDVKCNIVDLITGSCMHESPTVWKHTAFIKLDVVGMVETTHNLTGLFLGQC